MESKVKVLHLWGTQGQPSLVSPESIALCWMVNDSTFDSPVEVVFSNNTDLSPTGELPLLIEEDGKKSTGVYTIVQRLAGGSDRDTESSLLCDALLQFAADELKKCTMYQLFLNTVNYNEYTSKVYSYLLHWPFWYNTPLNGKACAQKLCQDMAISIPDDDDDLDSGAKGSQNSHQDKAIEMAQSQVFKVARDNKKQQKKRLQDLKNNSRVISNLTQILTHWTTARPAVDAKLIPADLLLAAHLKVQMDLPQGDIVNAHLLNNFPTLYSTVKEIQQRNSALQIPNIRDPSFTESGNVVMSTFNLIKTYTP